MEVSVNGNGGSARGANVTVAMSGASRRVKNPLLSAAGDSFAFENYAENPLLVPVTPATPAVLRDDPDLDNFIGQESVLALANQTNQNVGLTPVTLHPDENKNSASASAKHGYFTSILSSLPNLSLSSITGDSSSSVADNNVRQQNENPYVALHDPRSGLRETPPHLTANSNDPRGTSFSIPSEINLGRPTIPSTPPQPALPPTTPASSEGTVSYRLGNQRRLKYAPPPDLNSTSSRQYSTPPGPPLFAPPTSTTPTILNPNASIAAETYNPVEVSSASPQLVQYPTPDQLSQSSSVHESFRSSPIVGGYQRSSAASPLSVTPQTQGSIYDSVSSGRPKVTISCSKPIPSQVPEPATPQNTPANFSFSGFDLYTSQRDSLTSSNSEVEELVKSRYQPQTSKDNTPGSVSETRHESQLGTSGSSFALLSAVKVSEKLEHLLAEQKEQSKDSPPEPPPRSSENTWLTEGQTLDPQRNAKTDDTAANNGLLGKETLTDVFLGKEEPEPVQRDFYQVHQVSEDIKQPTETNFHESQPKTATAVTCQSFQQYRETPSTNVSKPDFFADNQPIGKAALNFTPKVQSPVVPNFFTENQRNEKSALNFIPKAESPNGSTSPIKDQVTKSVLEYNPASATEISGPNNLPNTSTVFQQSACSYFDSADGGESNRPPSSSGAVHSDVTSSSSKNYPESQATFIAVSSEQAIPVAQALWNPSPVQQTERLSSTHSAPVHPPPTFYNPTHFQTGQYKLPSVQPVFTPSFNQTQQYFDSNVPGHQFNAISGSGVVFNPVSSPLQATVVPEPSGSATLNPVQVSVNPLSGRHTPDTVPPSLQNLAAGPTDIRMQYRPVYHHWFYRKEVEHKVLWLPFSMQDSLQLEDVHNSSEISPETMVPTDGGRYDVNILRRQRTPVYWSGAPTEVRRCSWFYKGATESRYIPYDESTAVKLEEEYRHACELNNWNRRIDLNNGEYIIFHSASVHVHYSQPTSPELAASWGNSAGSEDSTYLQGAASRPRVIKRGLDEFHIEDGEPETIDHLLFLVHGIGSVCDLKFRTVEEVVDEFRSIAQQMIQSHYRTASEQRIVNRIEVLPISWHTTLHSEDTGIDKKLQAITLESIPKLRHFTNDTLLDILFYTSPVYCQTIIQTVGNEVNRLHALFRERNPSFAGGIFLGGHSLGSLILFDILCHQKPPTDKTPEENEDNENKDANETTGNASPIKPLPAPVLKRRLSKRISYVMGTAGTGQPFINYPQLNFHPRAFFALGSPIGMFVTIRGIDTLGEEFSLPTCPAFFNIFHPFDPVAYRVESLINSEACKYRPRLIPHHKGRKRMHLELKETMARVGADLKQRLLDSVRNTWNSVYQLALFHKPDNQALEREIDKVVEEQLQKPPSIPDPQNHDDGGADLKVGKLNGGRRIDYVLQEAPFEYINEYIFALTSHVCYWESEDTMLLMLKEIYGSAGIQSDAQLPQQTLSIERDSPLRSAPSLSPSISGLTDLSSPVTTIRYDPTAPISDKPVGPPPKTGFVRKS